MTIIALVGSGEYLPGMQAVDAHLLDAVRVPGRTPRVVCLPTAAGQEGEASWRRWLTMGERHFRALGAEVTGLPVIDRATADDPNHAAAVENADYIYFSGGDPHYLHQTLHDSRVWQAVAQAQTRGAVLAGCSAGAMILAHELPDFRTAGLTHTPAFGRLPVRLIFPHFDRWQAWRGPALALLRARLHETDVVLGIDEDTALVGRLHEPWTVLGRQTVMHITKHATRTFAAGETLLLTAKP